MKLRHLAVLLGAMVVFTGCSSTETTAPADTTAQTETTAPAASESAEGFTGVKVGEVKGEKDTTIAEVTFENGVPVDVKFDITMEDGKSKYEEAKNGNYNMGEGTTPWNEQVDALAAFLVENNFDISKVTYTNDEGNTDVVSGVSIKVPDLLKAVEEALK